AREALNVRASRRSLKRNRRDAGLFSHGEKLIGDDGMHRVNQDHVRLRCQQAGHVHALLDCVLLRVSPDHIRPHLRADLLDRAVDDLESLYAEGRHAPGDPDTPWPPNARLLSNLMAILSLTARRGSGGNEEPGEWKAWPLVELRWGDREGQSRGCAPASVLDGRGDAVQPGGGLFGVVGVAEPPHLIQFAFQIETRTER